MIQAISLTIPRMSKASQNSRTLSGGMVVRGYIDQGIENVLGQFMLRLMKEVIG